MTIVVPPGRISNVISIGRGIASGAVSLAVGPWGKLIGIALLCGGLAWGFRVWLNKHDDRIFQDGKERAIAVLEDKYVVTWKQKLAEAKIIADTGAANLKVAEAKMAEVNARFPVIFSKLDDLQKSVDAKWVVYVEKAKSVPLSELDNTIRAISNDPAISPPH